MNYYYYYSTIHAISVRESNDYYNMCVSSPSSSRLLCAVCVCDRCAAEDEEEETVIGIECVRSHVWWETDSVVVCFKLRRPFNVMMVSGIEIQYGSGCYNNNDVCIIYAPFRFWTKREIMYWFFTVMCVCVFFLFLYSKFFFIKSSRCSLIIIINNTFFLSKVVLNLINK